MVERLRSLSPPLRFAVYVIGVLLLFFLSIGLGAAATIVVGQRSGTVPAGSVEPGKSGGGTLETTGVDGTLEGKSIEPSNESEVSNNAGLVASFVHQATDKNSRGDYTVISHPSIDGHPNAVVLVSPVPDRGASGAASYDHNVGVWYAGAVGRWAIFNQDRAAVPAGSAFEVEIPEASAKFVHKAGLLNTVGNHTYIDNELTNGNPEAALSVTQNWNPGGGRGVYNDHPVDANYDTEVEKWMVHNTDGAPVPEEAAFNIAVSAGTDQGAR